jgi:hypothetical protein
MAHEGPVRSMAPRLSARVADTALRSAARTSIPRTTSPTHGSDPHRLSRRERCSTTRGLAQCKNPPVAGARAGGWATFLLTTHFSGADEARLEAGGSTMVGQNIMDGGKVVRASQLIRSVGQTK